MNIMYGVPTIPCKTDIPGLTDYDMIYECFELVNYNYCIENSYAFNLTLASRIVRVRLNSHLCFVNKVASVIK